MSNISDITTELPEILRTVDRPGNFATGGHFRFYPPRLRVEGVGTIALPLIPMQAETLIKAAQPAPYGRGEETLMDREVRRTWQVDAEQVSAEGEGWQESLEKLLAEVNRSLGVSGDTRAELYKLLIYDEGSFFVEHRDTEKQDGMFATLVIVLPSEYQGGELLVRHQETGQQEKEISFDLQTNAGDSVGYAAFYADCRHEVRPVTAGYRLTLIYNLIRTGKDGLPRVADYSRERQQATELLSAWVAAKQRGEENLPEKLIFPLEHAYSPAEIDFSALKNTDEAVASVLTWAAAKSDCEIYLALLSQNESGAAEYDGYYGGGRRGYYAQPEEEDFEISEVFDSEQKLKDWRTPDGNRPTLGALNFETDELCPPERRVEQRSQDEGLLAELEGCWEAGVGQ